MNELFELIPPLGPDIFSIIIFLIEVVIIVSIVVFLTKFFTEYWNKQYLGNVSCSFNQNSQNQGFEELIKELTNEIRMLKICLKAV